MADRSGGRRIAPWLLAAAIAALVAPGTAAAKTPSCLKPYSWVAGTTSLCRGAVVYGDYVGDDYGADDGETLNNRIGGLSPGAGDQDYPEGQEATADLVRLTLRVSGRRLLVSGLLNALYAPDQTVLAVAIDTDDKASTGGGAWRDLGISSKGWEKLVVFRRGDPRRNTIGGRTKLPKGKVWRVQAAVANAATGKVMNVAFRPNDHAGFGEGAASAASDSSAGSFFEDDQAEALAAGDVSAFGFRVKVSQMKRRLTRAARTTPGMHERVYTSRYTLPPGEGMSYDGVPGRGDGGTGQSLGFEQKFNFLGRYQPYGIYVPKRAGRRGLQTVFHGSGSNLSALISQAGMQRVVGEDLNRILVTPEGRGTEGWGSDISERDLLDVIADVAKTYGVDRSRVFAGGYSQGGYVTYRMASLHPDVFAGALDWVGFTGDGANGAPPGSPVPHYTGGAIGNAVDFVKNLLHVPTVMLYAGADELVHVWTGNAMNQAFQATDNTYRFYMHPTAEHLTFAGLDDWRKEAAYSKDLQLVRDPPRVVFTTAPFLDAPQYGIRHDRAYWLSALRGRGGEKDYATVDLTSAGCGGTVPTMVRSSATGDDPVPWTSDDQAVASTSPLAAEPRLTGKLTGVASATIDAKRTCLAGKAVAYDLTSDGPATLRLSDGRTIQLGDGRAQGTLGG
ncbi:MAG TPA: prolyl oligopeptidase family serine peptidase [Thermoleophilaceae bacterium]|jgi:pimeloyl-ACP methyl ester carboxylesterase